MELEKIKEDEGGSCAARSNRTVACDGEFIACEGLCLRHAVLFDFWIAEGDGCRVYRSPYPRRWKRSKFHRWLNTLTPQDVVQIENS